MLTEAVLHVEERITDFNITGGEISGNYADYGVGVAIWAVENFNMSGGVIKDNWGEFGGGGGLPGWVALFT
jgi:hypothetical protein